MPELRLEGPLTVSSAETRRAQLVAHLAVSPDLLVDLATASEFDVFGLQLLWSARQSAVRRGKPFRLLNAGADFVRACEQAGFNPAEFNTAQPSSP